ncbi:hypothetical protein ACFL2Q_09635 [Thermodesulfobacteriota bacterium]
MNELQLLKRLATAAAEEEPPRVDVSQRVPAILTAQELDSEAPFLWIAGLSSAAAVVVGVVAYKSLDTWTDPLQTLFLGLTWMMT